MPDFRRLTPLLALLTAVAILAAGILMVVYDERSYKAQKTDETTVQARILASTVTAALAFNDRAAAQEYIDAIQANPEAQLAALYDATGALFVGYARGTEQTLPATIAAALRLPAEDEVVVQVPVRQGDSALGAVYLRTTTEPIGRRLARYGFLGLLVTLAALVFAVLGVSQAALNRQAAHLAEVNASLRAQIAGREKAEAALRQAQKMEAIGHLTGGVAHDFNNLLQVILGNIEALQRRASSGDIPRKDEGFRRLTDAAARGAERAATLTRQLLAFSRRQPLDPKPVNVNKLVAGMSDMLHRTLGETVRIETVLAGGTWRVSADANQLESALLNLAVNARDAMPNGGKLTIETSNAFIDETYAAAQEELKPGQYVLIAVSDGGIGMTKEVSAQAFDPFFTTKDIGHGTGLGLSQVYGFVKQSGGYVKIYSEVGEGTTVKIYLPRLTGEVAVENEAGASRPASGAKEELILVVEDADDVRANSVEALSELGYGVFAATDGAAALRILAAEPRVRLLFTDVGLPGGMNGRELATEARRMRPHLLVLFTTGHARNAIVHHGRLDPGVELIAKPFTFTALASKVRHVLGDSNLNTFGNPASPQSTRPEMPPTGEKD